MAIPTNEVPPVRLVSRLASELALINLRASLRLVPNRFETSMIAKALLRGALPHLVSDGNLVLPTCQPMVGSISAIARSFGRPAETVRRHVHVLVRQGMFTVEPDGVRLAPNQASGERILFLLRNLHDGLLWLIGELHSWGLVRRPEGHGRRPVPLDVMLRAALDIRFMGYETFHKSVGGWTTIALWSVLNTVSVRHVTVNRRLSRQFAIRSTPDALRRPTSARTLATISGLPYATVWRHLVALERAGRVGRNGDGYVVQTEQLLTPEVEQLVVAYVVDVMNRVERLIAEGLDPEAIPSLFLGPKPEMVPVP